MYPNLEWWLKVFLGALALVGLGLTVVSAFSLCTAACAEAHLYRFYGYSFDLLGFLFFSSFFVILLFTSSLPILYLLLGFMAFSALGAEVIFILIQYFEIGQWCPICLSIALVIGLITSSIMALGWIHYKQQQSEGKSNMHARILSKTFGAGSALALGFLLALFGVAIPETSFADGTSENEDPIFGNRKSQIEIYFVSDWYCKACKEAEKKLSVILPKVMGQASVIFIDRMLHPESLNYLPYNLSFMLKEKEKYFALREKLCALTEETETPKPKDIQKAVASLNVTYKPLNFSDIESGMRYFQGICKTFEVNSTPTLVIANKKKVKAKKLVGNTEITEENIQKWIKELS